MKLSPKYSLGTTERKLFIWLRNGRHCPDRNSTEDLGKELVSICAKCSTAPVDLGKALGLPDAIEVGDFSSHSFFTAEASIAK
jgi:hypothetical protein